MTPQTIQQQPNPGDRFAATTLAAALANAEYAAQASLPAMNAALATNYATEFEGWAVNVRAGRAPGTNPPAVPLAYELHYFPDPTNPLARWAYTAQTGAPVCAPLPIPPDVVLHLGDAAKVGIKIPGTSDKWQALDTTQPTAEPVPAVSADGVVGWWQKHIIFGNLGYYAKVAMFLLCLSLASTSLRAQATVACSPQPMAATKSIGEQVMGPWACWVTAEGTAPYVLTPSRLYQAVATKISPVAPNIAQQIISDSIGKLPQSRFVKIGQVALALGGIGATVYTGNAQWSLIGGLVSQNAPKMIQVIENEIPSAAPFVGGQIAGPVTITPGGDIPAIVVYAMRMKKEKLAPFTVSLSVKP